ncbi:MAG: stage V sporulation protein D [Clostridiaceae bacterium]|jgi:penicillin-binding protein 2|nr:stage V sporulation protein D [Clostridiaceae bacterium]
MKKGRVLIILYALTVSIIAAGIRLYQIQVLSHDAYSSAAFRQRSRITEIYRERGQILDRNMISFTDRSVEYIAVLQPAVFTREKKEREYIAGILGVDSDEFINFSVFNSEPRVYLIDRERAKQLIDLKARGVSVVERRKRADADMPAVHLIGYTDETSTNGIVGIEKIYQDILNSKKSVFALSVADAKNQYLEEYGYQIREVNSNSPLSLKLTLDFHMQKLAEEVMDNMVDSGAVVIIDILTGDILVLASRPGFNPEEVSKYLNDRRQPLFNRAIAGYTPGSIFKIITTAAALEENLDPDTAFNCPGFCMIGDQMFKCWNYDNGGHGILNLKYGFAQSCNSYFIQLGLVIGAEKLLATAEKFGLGSVTGLTYQKIPEYEGLLPDKEELIGDGNIANLSIGQGKILITPIQAAGMAAIIANGGIRNNLNLVDSIVNKNGDIIRDLKKREWERVISRETAKKLMEMMEATVESGTGQKADIGGYGGSAGKTGSAETGLFEGDRRIIHAWFTGYFPYKEPRYAMCVFVEDGSGGGTSAAPIFAEIAARIMQWEEMK